MKLIIRRWFPYFCALCFFMGLIVKLYYLSALNILGEVYHGVELEFNGVNYSAPLYLCSLKMKGLESDKDWIGINGSITVKVVYENANSWLANFENIVDELLDSEEIANSSDQDYLIDFLEFKIADYYKLGITQYYFSSDPFEEQKRSVTCLKMNVKECALYVKSIAKEINGACFGQSSIDGQGFQYVPERTQKFRVSAYSTKEVIWNLKPVQTGENYISVRRDIATTEIKKILVTKIPGIPFWLSEWGAIFLMFLGPAATFPWIKEKYFTSKNKRTKIGGSEK